MSTLKSLLRRIVRPLRRSTPRPPSSSEPSGSLIERARSIAFIVNAATDAKGQKWFDAAKARGAEIDMLPLFQP
ncbi:MAG TPA: hypothetical protein VFV07_00245, partial [Rhizomicrobium sp.]|nr:hypothetical protein [Rhizomicrobium sp.]